MGSSFYTMTPKEVLKALAEGHWEEAGKAILAQDLFIGYPAERGTTWTGDLRRYLTYACRCNGCGWNMPIGMYAYWIKGWGGWHTWCFNDSQAERLLGMSPRIQGDGLCAGPVGTGP